MISEKIKNSVLTLAQKNKTPFYCYSTDIISEKISLLRNNLPENFQIFYSLKANAHPFIVHFIKSKNISFDVTSLSEMQTVLDAGAEPSQVSFTGPGKTREDIDRILKAKIGFINIESRQELDYILSQNYSHTKLLLRVAWPFSSNQFGIDLNEIKELLKHEFYSKHICGLHTHFLTQQLDAEKLFTHLKKSLDLAVDLKNHHGLNLLYLNFGSGLGVPYFKEDKAFNLKLFHEKLSEYLNLGQIKKELGKTQLMLETGRFLVAESGFYITRVTYKKVLRENIFLIVDGGIHHFMAATGVSQLIKRPFFISSFEKRSKEIVTIAGKTCSDLDIFARDIELSAVNEGEIICIENAGAYGIDYSPVNFCHHEKPLEIFIES